MKLFGKRSDLLAAEWLLWVFLRSVACLFNPYKVDKSTYFHEKLEGSLHWRQNS